MAVTVFKAMWSELGRGPTLSVTLLDVDGDPIAIRTKDVSPFETRSELGHWLIKTMEELDGQLSLW